jgi:hypothetical protein
VDAVIVGAPVAILQSALYLRATGKWDDLFLRFGKNGMRPEYDAKSKVLKRGASTNKTSLLAFLDLAEQLILKDDAVPLQAVDAGVALVSYTHLPCLNIIRFLVHN